MNTTVHQKRKLWRASLATANFWANFGITGSSAKAVAVTTAAVWTASVPLLGIFTYLKTQSDLLDTVPDVVALQHFVRQAGTSSKKMKWLEEMRALDIKEKGISYWGQFLGQGMDEEFATFLLTKLPKKTLQTAKKEVLELWKQSAVTDKIQLALSVAAVLDVFVLAIAKGLSYISQLGIEAVSTLSILFTGFAIGGAVLSVLSSLYQVYRDFTSAKEITSVQVLSVIRLVVTIAAASLAVVMLCTPGLNLSMIGALFALGMTNVILDYARSRRLAHQFKVAKAAEPETVAFMRRLWQQTRAAGQKTPDILRSWIKLIKSDDKLIHLIPA